jgi:deoxyribodipyrimidine photo-lyase
VLGAPATLPQLPGELVAGQLPSLAALGLRQEVSSPAIGGERAGREAVARFLAHNVSAYERSRDQLGEDRTSRLSPYLHFGCVSARELERALPAGSGGQALRRQLCWRDFYAQVLAAFPGNTRREHQPRWRGRIRWSEDQTRFDAWSAGYTGYPLVDAGMRQLRAEGWMHNRARLVVGSFLTKDLGINWRWGERLFMRLLLDGDQASNNGNWQWIASVGVDPQPVARRIFNPARQQDRFDADGRYVRAHVPELREVPDEYLREPWRMPIELQRSLGTIIGTDYPAPIVDHQRARHEALERFAAAGASR